MTRSKQLTCPESHSWVEELGIESCPAPFFHILPPDLFLELQAFFPPSPRQFVCLETASLADFIFSLVSSSERSPRSGRWPVCLRRNYPACQLGVGFTC